MATSTPFKRLRSKVSNPVLADDMHKKPRTPNPSIPVQVPSAEVKGEPKRNADEINGIKQLSDDSSSCVKNTPCELYQKLDAISGLSELHTHLLGMGNAEFWINSVICDTEKLPKSRLRDCNETPESKREHFRLDSKYLLPLIWDTEKKEFFPHHQVADFFQWFIQKGFEDSHNINDEIPETKKIWGIALNKKRGI